MKKFDGRHFIFHVLVALYFIWVVVFAALISMAMANISGADSPLLDKAIMTWILVNFLTGSALYIVIKLFRYTTMLVRIITYSYIFLALAGIAAVAVIIG